MRVETDNDFKIQDTELAILVGLEAPPSVIAFDMTGLGTHKLLGSAGSHPNTPHNGPAPRNFPTVGILGTHKTPSIHATYLIQADNYEI